MTRLTLSLIAVVMLAILGLGAGLDVLYNQETHVDPWESHKHIAKALARQLDAAPPAESPEDSLEPERDTLNALNQAVRVLPYAEFPLPADIRDSFEKGEPLLLEDGRLLTLHYYLPQRQQVLVVELPDNRPSPAQLRLTLVFYAGVACLLLVWLAPLLRRLSLLRRMAEAVGRGDLQARIPTAGISYIRDIERAFNAMAARIGHLIQDNKILSRGLSHDLRTPLARLRFGLDVLTEDMQGSPLRARFEHFNRDLSEMELLVETLLEYSKLEEANIHLPVKKFELQPFVEDFLQQNYGDQVQFVGLLQSEDSICGHREYLALLLNNMLQNAIRYGAGAIRLTLKPRAQHLTLMVEDNGPGIPAEQREAVLKPFVRLDNTPAHLTSKGFGMGLALVERICHWHHARLQLRDSQDLGGLKIRVVFDRA
jgi:signal transduction histidine kinase